MPCLHWIRLNSPISLSLLRLYLVVVVYCAVSCLAINSFMTQFGFLQSNVNSPKYGLAVMLDGSAYQPFAFRALVPTIVNTIGPERLRAFIAFGQQVFPGRVDQGDPLQDVRSRFIDAKLLDDPILAAQYYFVYLICFVSLVLALLALRGATRFAYPGSSLMADAGPVVFAVLLPIVFQHGGYFYDFPELLFMALAFWAVLSDRPAWLVAVLPLAALNKETALLLAAPLAVGLLLGERRKLPLFFLACGTALGAALHLVVRTSVSGNVSPDSFQLWQNLAFWTTRWPYQSFTTILAPGIPFPKAQNVLILVPLGALIAVGGKGVPPQVLGMLLIASVVNFPLFLIFCYIDEVRNLSLIFVPLYLSSVGAWLKLANQERIP